MANSTKFNIVQNGNNNQFSFEYTKLNITDPLQYIGNTVTQQSKYIWIDGSGSNQFLYTYFLNKDYDNIVEKDADDTNKVRYDSSVANPMDCKVAAPYDRCSIYIPDSYTNTDFLVQIGISEFRQTYFGDDDGGYTLQDAEKKIDLFSGIIPSSHINLLDTPVKLNSITYNKAFGVPIPALHLFESDTILDMSDSDNWFKPLTDAANLSTGTISSYTHMAGLTAYLMWANLVISKKDKRFEDSYKDVPDNYNLIKGYTIPDSVFASLVYYLLKYRQDNGLSVDSEFGDIMNYIKTNDYNFDDEYIYNAFFNEATRVFHLSNYILNDLSDNYEFYIKITPIKFDDDLSITYLGDEVTSYFTMNSSEELDDSEDDSSIKCKLSTTNLTETDQSKFGLLCKLEFDDQYNTIKDWLQNYTVDEITDGSVHYILEFKDDENIYYTEESGDIKIDSKSYKTLFYPSFDSWDYYIEGMYCDVKCIISYNDKQIILTSNKINVTPSIYRFFIEGLNYGGKKIYNIDINKIPDVQIIDIQAINKVVNNVVQMSRSNDFKSSIQKPVYIKTQPTDSITLHSNVNENVCINLDSYKSSTNLFLLKIDGTSYTEIGRISSGVIFKVNTSMEVGTSGTYYIIDQENNLITTGSYKIV